MSRHPTRANRSALPNSPSAGVRDATTALEEIITHLPGEDRDSVLVLAEEHAVPRAEGEAALGLLEKHGHVRRLTDVERALQRWELSPAVLPALGFQVKWKGLEGAMVREK